MAILNPFSTTVITLPSRLTESLWHGGMTETALRNTSGLVVTTVPTRANAASIKTVSNFITSATATRPFQFLSTIAVSHKIPITIILFFSVKQLTRHRYNRNHLR